MYAIPPTLINFVFEQEINFCNSAAGFNS